MTYSIHFFKLCFSKSWIRVSIKLYKKVDFWNWSDRFYKCLLFVCRLPKQLKSVEQGTLRTVPQDIAWTAVCLRWCWVGRVCLPIGTIVSFVCFEMLLRLETDLTIVTWEWLLIVIAKVVVVELHWANFGSFLNVIGQGSLKKTVGTIIIPSF